MKPKIVWIKKIRHGFLFRYEQDARFTMRFAAPAEPEYMRCAIHAVAGGRQPHDRCEHSNSNIGKW